MDSGGGDDSVEQGACREGHESSIVGDRLLEAAFGFCAAVTDVARDERGGKVRSHDGNGPLARQSVVGCERSTAYARERRWCASAFSVKPERCERSGRLIVERVRAATCSSFCGYRSVAMKVTGIP